MMRGLQMPNEIPASRRSRLGVSQLPIVGVALVLLISALITGTLVLNEDDTLLAEGAANCPVTDLGILDSESELQADGRWTTNECDSRFRANSDAHTYRFEVSEAGRIRLNLSSEDSDSYLYLMTEDGARITENDDGGVGLDARIERTLDPGVYLVEATTVGGRDRGAADFTLSVSYVQGCEITDLGALLPGADLTASGSWNIDTCGSRFVEAHPAYGYSFSLPQAGTVRVDLVSEDGDPVLSMASATGNVIGANDDGGGGRNARIERFLQPGIYLIEATTYLERDLQPLAADFDLTVHLVDDEEKQDRVLIKVEATDVPKEVVAGEPFTINYRVGNLGGGNLADIGGNAIVYVVGPRVFERTDAIDASENVWQPGASHHSSEEMATSASTSVDELTPLEITFNRAGPSWVFVAVVADDEDENEVSWHGIWHNLMVLGGPTFDSVPVRVESSSYEVSAEADEEGEVTNSVTSVSTPGAEVDEDTEAKAVYAAGVRLRMLDGIFERETISELSVGFARKMLTLESPSSGSLLKAFTEQYTVAIADSGLSEGFAAGEAINPSVIEDVLIDSADLASAQYSSMASYWTSHQVWAENGRGLLFTEAVTLHSQLNYAENVIAPTVQAGKIVRAAREAELGWEDPDVQAMVDELDGRASCHNAEARLRSALEAAGVEDVDGSLELDAEMRSVLPVFGSATDSVLCAMNAVDNEISGFLRLFSISGNAALRELLTTEPPVTAAQYQLRIVARLDDDGRVEHGITLAHGEQVLPSERYLPADAPVGEWQLSSDVEVDDDSIGQIRTRWLEDGRIELGFVSVGGGIVTPDIRFLAADIPTGVWLQSSEIEIEVQNIGSLE